MNDATKKEIDQTITKHKIVLFTKGTKDAPQCGFSAATIDCFKKLNVPFETVDVMARPDLRDGIKEYSNWPTIPQVYVGGKFVGGCDIAREMFANGELKKLVDQAMGK